MIKLIKPVLASVDLGPIEGVGVFQKDLEGNIATQTDLFISQMIGTITIVGGLAFVIYFFIGALKWITAGGDKGKVQEAQSQMTNGAIGLIAITAAFFIIGIVGGVLGIDIIQPMSTLFPAP